jgi:hypothetical protein
MYLRFLTSKIDRKDLPSQLESADSARDISSTCQSDDDAFAYAVRRHHLIVKFDLFQEYEWRLEMVDQEVCSSQEQLLAPLLYE